MLGSWRTRGDSTWYARAMPEKVELTETYAIEREISKNASIQQIGDGVGQIEITVPYDGSTYFSRAGVADVEREAGRAGVSGDRRATIGHLLLADHTQTTGLNPVMRSHGPAASIPVSVPVATQNGRVDLTGDRRTCVITHDYQPDNPQLYPIDVDVQLYDRDRLIGELDEARTMVTMGRDNPSAVLERMRQAAQFTNDLVVCLTVQISVPVKKNAATLNPMVKTMAVEWPTLTSMSSTELTTLWPGLPTATTAVRYNPTKARLEWRDVPMYQQVAPNENVRDAGTRICRSALMVLTIGHPGDLYKQERLEVNAEVEIPDYLLSGLEAQLFNAVGRSGRRPKHTTKVSIRAFIYPADIFAQRTFSPYQQFVVDDIIPTEMRVTDIINVLRNARFTLHEGDPWKPSPQDDVEPTWLLRASRTQGPDTLDLMVAVEGRRSVVDVREIVAGTKQFTSDRDTGQIKVSVLGSMPRDHRELTREMNALQAAVRERFRYHQMTRGGMG